MQAKVIHFADKADIEIGTARCGARLQGAVHTAENGKVTCVRCNSSLSFENAAKNLETQVAGDPGPDQRIIDACEELSGLAQERGDVEAEQFWDWISGLALNGPRGWLERRAAQRDEELTARTQPYRDMIEALKKDASGMLEKIAEQTNQLIRAGGEIEDLRAYAVAAAKLICLPGGCRD